MSFADWILYISMITGPIFIFPLLLFVIGILNARNFIDIDDTPSKIIICGLCFCTSLFWIWILTGLVCFGGFYVSVIWPSLYIIKSGEQFVGVFDQYKQKLIINLQPEIKTASTDKSDTN